VNKPSLLGGGREGGGAGKAKESYNCQKGSGVCSLQKALQKASFSARTSWQQKSKKSGQLVEFRLRGGLDVQRSLPEKKELLPSFLRRRPRDSMSLARRELNSQLFTPDGLPDFRITAAQRRLMHDQVVQWTWLQLRLRYTETDAEKPERQFEDRVAITDEEAFDYVVLHYLIVEAHTAQAAAYMSLLGIDGTPYVRADDPMRQAPVLNSCFYSAFASKFTRELTFD
jgi:hypothetical protein